MFLPVEVTGKLFSFNCPCGDGYTFAMDDEELDQNMVRKCSGCGREYIVRLEIILILAPDAVIMG